MCPKCRGEYSHPVISTRKTKDAVYRRRRCGGCNTTFVTMEHPVDKMPKGVDGTGRRRPPKDEEPFHLGTVWR